MGRNSDRCAKDHYMDIVDDLIIVASEDKLISSEEIVAVLKWNPETEQFVLEQ